MHLQVIKLNLDIFYSYFFHKSIFDSRKKKEKNEIRCPRWETHNAEDKNKWNE